MAELVFVRVNSADLYKTGHMANRWFGQISRQLSVNTRAAAPSRTGTMKKGIHTNMHAVPQARRMEIDWWSEVPYTLYVLRGTTSPIMARGLWEVGGQPAAAFTKDPEKGWVGVRGRWMRVRPAPFSYYAKPTHRLYVAGQRRNNFLSRGWRKTAIRHAVMRPTPNFIKNP